MFMQTTACEQQVISRTGELWISSVAQINHEPQLYFLLLMIQSSNCNIFKKNPNKQLLIALVYFCWLFQVMDRTYTFC